MYTILCVWGITHPDGLHTHFDTVSIIEFILLESARAGIIIKRKYSNHDLCFVVVISTPVC